MTEIMEIAGCENFHEGVCSLIQGDEENMCEKLTHCEIRKKVEEAQKVLDQYKPHVYEDE